jgi:twitching motility protein PilT
MFDLHAALKHVVDREASDLHLKSAGVPRVRTHGVLEPMAGAGPMSVEEVEGVLAQMLSDDTKLEEFRTEGEVDFAYSLRGVARFRVNAFRQTNGISIACRTIHPVIRTVADLQLPPVVSDLADEERGLILLTGTTGSGKSTTLAAMIGQINATKPRHVVTIEDPIEYLHTDNLSVINQREVGEDTVSFGRALRRVLRQDPDVILIGEMRDHETVATALSAAETGHLVLSTLHTVDAPETINRIIDFFPPHQQNQVRAMLASTLKGVISQRLVQTVTGDGRLPACEVMVATGRVRDMIMDREETARIPEAIAEGEFYGMQTFDQALMRYIEAGKVTLDEALRASSRPHDLKLMLAAGGRDAASVESLIERHQAEHAA